MSSKQGAHISVDIHRIKNPVIRKAYLAINELSKNTQLPVGSLDSMNTAVHTLSLRCVTIDRHDGGYVMRNQIAGLTVLTFTESLVWRLFKRPPKGYFVMPDKSKDS